MMTGSRRNRRGDGLSPMVMVVVMSVLVKSFLAPDDLASFTPA